MYTNRWQDIVTKTNLPVSSVQPFFFINHSQLTILTVTPKIQNGGAASFLIRKAGNEFSATWF